MAKKSAASEQLDAERDRGMGDNIGPAGAEHLRSLEGRIVNLLDQRDEINEDIAEVFKEVKDAGFETKIVRKVIQTKRRMDKDPAGFNAAQELEDLYFDTLYPLPFEAENPGLAENRKATEAPEQFEASEEELAAQKVRTAMREAGMEESV